MKKLLITLSIVFTVGLGHSQTVSEDVISKSEPLGQLGNNEIRLNLLTSVFAYPEINYEYFLEDNMGVGVAVAFALEGKDEMDLRFQVVPYYRLYFGEKKAAGFFIEGNMAIAKQTDYWDWDDYNEHAREESTNFGLGFAAGGKFLTRNGFVGEAYLGVGRLFGNSIVGAYPRVGLSIGKRF